MSISERACVRESYALFLYVIQIQDPSQAKVMDTVVFEGPPMTEQVLWPAHCVQNSWGSELHKDLTVKQTLYCHGP